MSACLQFHIQPERPQDAELIQPLLDRTFGPERHQKTVYRLREGIAAVPELSFVATGVEGEMLASLRFWPVDVAGRDGVLLGPLAVEPKLQGQGIGRALVRHGLEVARRMRVPLCLVVGEPAYYEPYGFRPATPEGLILPGPVEPRRFQALELLPGALEGVRGPVSRDERFLLGGSRKPAARAGRS